MDRVSNNRFTRGKGRQTAWKRPSISKKKVPINWLPKRHGNDFQPSASPGDRGTGNRHELETLVVKARTEGLPFMDWRQLEPTLLESLRLPPHGEFGDRMKMAWFRGVNPAEWKELEPFFQLERFDLADVGNDVCFRQSCERRHPSHRSCQLDPHKKRPGQGATATRKALQPSRSPPSSGESGSHRHPGERFPDKLGEDQLTTRSPLGRDRYSTVTIRTHTRENHGSYPGKRFPNKLGEDQLNTQNVPQRQRRSSGDKSAHLCDQQTPTAAPVQAVSKHDVSCLGQEHDVTAVKSFLSIKVHERRLDVMKSKADRSRVDGVHEQGEGKHGAKVAENTAKKHLGINCVTENSEHCGFKNAKMAEKHASKKAQAIYCSTSRPSNRFEGKITGEIFRNTQRSTIIQSQGATTKPMAAHSDSASLGTLSGACPPVHRMSTKVPGKRSLEAIGAIPQPATKSKPFRPSELIYPRALTWVNALADSGQEQERVAKATTTFSPTNDKGEEFTVPKDFDSFIAFPTVHDNGEDGSILEHGAQVAENTRDKHVGKHSDSMAHPSNRVSPDRVAADTFTSEEPALVASRRFDVVQNTASSTLPLVDEQDKMEESPFTSTTRVAQVVPIKLEEAALTSTTLDEQEIRVKVEETASPTIKTESDTHATRVNGIRVKIEEPDC